MRIKTPKFFSMAAIILSAALLQACGGQRDEPFDGGTSSSSSSRGPAVTIDLMGKGTNPITDVSEAGVQVHILDEESLDTYWENYTEDTHKFIDFDKGQVLLVDLGKKRSCDHKITFKTYAAYQDTPNSVQVILNYKDVDASSSSNSSSSSSSSSSCDVATEIQPFYFFYIETRDEVLVVEDAN